MAYDPNTGPIVPSVYDVPSPFTSLQFMRDGTTYLNQNAPVDYRNQTNAITDNYAESMHNLRGNIAGQGSNYLGDIFSQINQNQGTAQAGAAQATANASAMGRGTDLALTTGQQALGAGSGAQDAAASGLTEIQNLYNQSFSGPLAYTQGQMGDLYGSGLATGGLSGLDAFAGAHAGTSYQANALGGMSAPDSQAGQLANISGAGLDQAGLLGQQRGGGAAASLGLRSLANNGTGRANSGLDLLGQFATQGPGASAADAMLAKQADQTAATNIAIARSGRGAGQNSAALRQAMFANAAGGQQLGNDMATLRANELATARGQNLTAAQAYAQGAQGLLGTQGSLLGQSGQLDQGAEGQRIQALVASGQMTQAEAAQRIAALQASGQLAQGAHGQDIQALIASGQLDQGQSGQELAALQALTQGSNAAAGTQGNLLNNLAGSQFAQQGQQAGMLNNYTQGQTALLNQDIGLYGQSNQLAGTMGNLGLGYSQLGEGYTGMGMNNEAAMMGLYGQGATSFGQLQGNLANQEWQGVQGGANSTYNALADYQKANAEFANRMAINNSQTAIENRKVNDQENAAMWSMIGTAGAAALPLLAALSDERAKTNIHDESEAFDLRPARGYAYEYSNPEMLGAAPGVHFGPMAQDLERTPAGRTVVREIGGRKMVDTSRLALVLTGAVSEQQRESDSLKARIRALEALLGGEAA